MCNRIAIKIELPIKGSITHNSRLSKSRAVPYSNSRDAAGRPARAGFMSEDYMLLSCWKHFRWTKLTARY